MRAISRRRFGSLALSFVVSAVATGRAAAGGLAQRRVALEAFATAPFPYRGKIPDDDSDFLDVNTGGRLGHTSGRGGVYWEDETYSDKRVLLGVPRGFDAKKHMAVVVFLHGNGAILERDVLRRQAVMDQLEASKLNAVLVAPQFAVDAQDSSAGRFWLKGAFTAFMGEAGVKLTKLAGGDGKLHRAVDTAPIILVAYSGGYDPAAYILANGDEHARIKGVVLLDALFGEEDKFAAWIARHHKAAFFVSAYSLSSADGNGEVEQWLQKQKIPVLDAPPSKLGLGVISFIAAPDEANHNDFVTSAWVDWPLQALLSRIVL